MTKKQKRKRENFVLTNGEKYDIINRLLSMAKEEDLKFFMEVNADKLVNHLVSHDERFFACLFENRMSNYIANLEKTTDYLINCFYQTGKRYSCTRTKIGKLLSIIAFVYAKKGKIIFKEKIYKYNNCGASIDELKSFVDRDVYLCETYYDDKIQITENFEVEFHFDKSLDVSDDENTFVNCVTDVFRRFGAYPASDLGKCINPIVDYPQISDDNGIVDLSKLEALTFDSFTNCENLDVIKYIF